MSKIFDQIPALSFLWKEFSPSYPITLIIFVTLFYKNTDINTLCSDELMVIRLSEAFWWGKNTDLVETIGRNLGNIFARKVMFCMLLLALFSYYTENSKTYTSSSPSTQPWFQKTSFDLICAAFHPLMAAEGSSLQAQVIWKRIVSWLVSAFHLPLRYLLHETKLVMANLQEDAITFLPSTLL